MRTNRGFSLVEGMVAVSLIGIVSVIAGTTAVFERRVAAAVVDGERAAQLLEYEADCLSTGRKPDSSVLAKLQAELPNARVEVAKSGRAATITVSWKRGATASTRSLTVFTKGGR
jgi:prepilin-type N-terminal cleavage/methylation domain-containing protein